MRLLLKLLLSALVVVGLSKILPGVSVDSYLTAFIVAIVLAILNLIVKPVLVLFTLPVTIITFGFFLLIINAIIIFLADSFVGGFSVDGWFMAIVFSLLFSLFQSILYSLLDKE